MLVDGGGGGNKECWPSHKPGCTGHPTEKHSGL